MPKLIFCESPKERLIYNNYAHQYEWRDRDTNIPYCTQCYCELVSYSYQIPPGNGAVRCAYVCELCACISCSMHVIDLNNTTRPNNFPISWMCIDCMQESCEV